MAKKASPWWWEARKGWYVQLDGQRHFLGEHPESRPKPRKGKTGWNAPQEILDALATLQKGQPQAGDSVAVVLDDFIGWNLENRSELTVKGYQKYCQDFINFSYSEVKLGELDVNVLTSAHVTAWLASKSTWQSTTKRNAITALIRAFNWAVKNRGLGRNPISGMEKPQANSPREIITPEEFENLIKHTSPRLTDLLIVSYDCGARPNEIKDLEKRHIDLEKSRAVIHADEAKGRKKTRVVYFPTERSLEIIQRLCENRPEGTLFVNERGNKWTSDAVKNAFARLEPKVGKRFTHYSFRRGFITRKIIAGVDSHVVAQLSGHQSTEMIDRHYSAVAADHEFLLEQAKKDID